jgi:hypothetical protein
VSLTTFETDARPRFGYPYHYAYGGTDPGGSTESFDTTYYDPNDTGLTNAMGRFTFDDTVFDGFLAANPGGGFGYGFAVVRTSTMTLQVHQHQPRGLHREL